MIVDVHFTVNQTFYDLLIKYQMHFHFPTLPKEEGKKGVILKYIWKFVLYVPVVANIDS